MNTNIQFINRVAELRFLENQLEKPASFTVIYGRRRVGKSELLKRFAEGKKALYLLATQEVEKEIAENFSKKTAEHFQDETPRINPFGQLKQWLEYLRFKDLEDRIILLDEFPYLIDANNAFPSILQYYWDSHFKQKKLHLILCGSSISSMEFGVLGRKSPLYGRRTGQWKVDPLSFKEYAEFFPGAEMKTIIEFYAITGGIPLYAIEFDGRKTAAQNAHDVIATRGNLLYQEAEILMKEEMREPRTYFSILKESAQGKTTPNEIANVLGVPRTHLARYIDTLAQLDLIEPVKPVTADEKTRNTRYKIKDNYFHYWFKFIHPFQKDLDSFQYGTFMENMNNFNAYVGTKFETVARQFLQVQNPIHATQIGTWWGAYRQDGTRKTAEIDVVALNETQNQILFGECKWQDGVDAPAILEKLENKARLVEWKNDQRQEHYAVFAKSFKRRINNQTNIHCYDLEDLEKTLQSPR